MSNDVKKYRSKPVVIEAVQFTKPGDEELLEWINREKDEEGNDRAAFMWATYGRVILIKTLEGMMDCPLGWWVIKGTKGEFYPCRDDVFREKYEAVS